MGAGHQVPLEFICCAIHDIAKFCVGRPIQPIPASKVSKHHVNQHAGKNAHSDLLGHTPAGNALLSLHYLSAFRRRDVPFVVETRDGLTCQKGIFFNLCGKRARRNSSR